VAEIFVQKFPTLYAPQLSGPGNGHGNETITKVCLPLQWLWALYVHRRVTTFFLQELQHSVNYLCSWCSKWSYDKQLIHRRSILTSDFLCSQVIQMQYVGW